jgi:biopolymer transport protein ExbD
MITPASSESDAGHGFQIAPMVDVVFVLLLFFMALAGLRQVERRLDVNLPAGGGETVPLVIDITARGAVLCNGLEVASARNSDVARLETWLRNLAATEPNISVLIRPDPATEHERFVQVLAGLRNVGLKKISFA